MVSSKEQDEELRRLQQWMVPDKLPTAVADKLQTWCYRRNGCASSMCGCRSTLGINRFSLTEAHEMQEAPSDKPDKMKRD
jgi:hypothetical protein